METWNVLWRTPDGKRQILRAGVSQAAAFAWRVVFPWCRIERVESAY